MKLFDALHLPTVVSLFASLLIACSGQSEEPVMSREALMDPETCKDCHPKHYDEWSGSMHAYAGEDPVFIAMNARGQEETGGKLGNFCVNCHAPLAVSEGAVDDPAKVEEIPRHLRGVTCYFCHNATGVDGTHNNPLVLANDQTMRGGIADPVKNKAHRSEYSALHDGDSIVASSSMCGGCHDLVVPKDLSGATEDVHLERTYAEYEETLFNDEGARGLSCSNCHMIRSRQLEPVADYEGVLSRPRYVHSFPGVDTAITDFPQRDVQLAEVQRLLDVSLRAVLCVNQTGGIKVVLDNIGVGHNFPSGASQDRRVWTEVVAYDDTGAVLYSSGVVADDQPVADLADPDLWLLRDRTFDVNGAEAHMFWDVARVETTAANGASSTIPGARAYDPTDPEFGVEQQQHEFPGSATIGQPARVTLRVRVRAMDFDVLDDLIASGHLSDTHRSAFSTVDVNPNRARSDVLVEWTPDAFENGIQDGNVLGQQGACVQTGDALR